MLRQLDVESAARKAQTQEVFRDVHPGRGKTAAEIQQEILAAHRAHGVEPVTDYSRVSRFISAATAKRGARLKFAKELVIGLRDAKRWLDRHSEDDLNEDQDS